jgi:hypothetical protein
MKTTRRSTRRFSLALSILLTPTWLACGDKTPVLTAPPSTTTTTAPPTVKSISIGGVFTLTAVGETTQLVVTATLSDNTTKNVTSEGKWQWGDGRVVTIGSSGLLTVVGFGATWISFNTANQSAGKTVTATPPGTFVIAGRVREPGRGGLANARVVDTLSGRSSTSDPDGNFSVAELSNPQGHLKVEKERYETVDVDATGPNVDLPLQEVIRLTAGETTYPAPLAPNDLSYVVGGSRCNDCRLIRVVVPQAGTVHIHVTWMLAAQQLSLFAEGQVVKGGTRELIADLAVNASREVLMYLGAAPPAAVTAHTSFIFETSLR